MMVTAPVGFSIATPTRSIIGGEYSIDINYDNVMENDGQSLVDHAFIIRIIEQDGSISYIMQVCVYWSTICNPMLFMVKCSFICPLHHYTYLCTFIFISFF